MKYLGIDYGTKRTGLAVCNADETITSPLAVIKRRKDLLNKILDVVASEQIEAVVIGLPLNMNGSRGAQAKKVMEFTQALRNKTDLPIYLHDERLSTFAAEEKLAAAELTRKEKNKRLDAIAAAEILQFFLESKKR